MSRQKYPEAPPGGYDINRQEPMTVHALNNESTRYYEQRLMLKLFSIFEFTNVPKHWDVDYMMYHLFMNGYFGIVNTYTNKYGTVPQKGTVAGMNIYDKPTEFLYANHIINGRRHIGIDCEIVYLNWYQHTFIGVYPLIKRYAQMLAQCDMNINTTLINSRVAHWFEVDTKSQASQVRAAYDKVTKGFPFVVTLDGDTVNSKKQHAYFNDVKRTYIANEVLITKRTLVNEFLTEIGISNANTDKKERLNEAEVTANKGEVLSNVCVWKFNISEGFKRVNRTFGTNIGVQFNKEVIEDRETLYDIDSGGDYTYEAD